VSIFAFVGESILALARKANVAIDAPCSGNGSCGKCRVKLISGTVESEESRHLTQEEYEDGWRLACLSKVNGDATVNVPDIASAYKGRLKVTDLSTQAEKAVFMQMQEALEHAGLTKDSKLTAIPLKLTPPTLDDTMPDSERLLRAACKVLKPENMSDLKLAFTVLKKLPDVLRQSDFNVNIVVDCFDKPYEIIDVLAAGDLDIYGLAIDIGTTTVSCLLVNLTTGKIISKANTGNGQIRYGADVINRIIEQQKPDGVSRLAAAVVSETLVPLIFALCEDMRISSETIYEVTIASNTTMNHLLLGINANHLRMEPYIPAFFEIDPIKGSDIGLNVSPEAKISFAPNIGSYVGGDITAGTLSGMLWKREEMALLIDLGTNGEIVFGNKDFAVACACSAGPAFEGGDISCGMRATDGAIEACTIDAKTMQPSFNVAGGGAPVGICGSGIIDIVAELYRTGIIDGKGKFNREGSRIFRDEYGIGRYIIEFGKNTDTSRDIVISETDIDNFIRAKGAIFSAVMSLISPLGFSPEDIECVMVAGGIGSGINIKNAIRIGMFPDLPAEKYSYIGNSSLSGAYAMLVSSKAREKLFEVAKSMTYVELSTNPGYMDSFVAACFIPHTDVSLFPGRSS